MKRRLHYEGEVEIEMADGCYPAVYLTRGEGLANKISEAIGQEEQAGWFPPRSIHRARITVEILELDDPVKAYKPQSPANFEAPPAPPAGSLPNL